MLCGNGGMQKADIGFMNLSCWARSTTHHADVCHVIPGCGWLAHGLCLTLLLELEGCIIF